MQKGFFEVVVIVGLVLLITIGAGAYYLGTKNKINFSPASLTPQATVRPQTQETNLSPTLPIPSDLNKWTDRRDRGFYSKYPYEMKYDGGFDLFGYSIADFTKAQQQQTNEGFPSMFTDLGISEAEYITISYFSFDREAMNSIAKYGPNTDLARWAKVDYDESKVEFPEDKVDNLENITVGGETAYKLEITYSDSGKKTILVYLYNPQKNTFMRVTASIYDPKNTGYKLLLDKILSSMVYSNL